MADSSLAPFVSVYNEPSATSFLELIQDVFQNIVDRCEVADAFRLSMVSNALQARVREVLRTRCEVPVFFASGSATEPLWSAAQFQSLLKSYSPSFRVVTISFASHGSMIQSAAAIQFVDIVTRELSPSTGRVALHRASGRAPERARLFLGHLYHHIPQLISCISIGPAASISRELVYFASAHNLRFLSLFGPAVPFVNAQTDIIPLVNVSHFRVRLDGSENSGFLGYSFPNLKNLDIQCDHGTLQSLASFWARNLTPTQLNQDNLKNIWIHSSAKTIDIDCLKPFLRLPALKSLSIDFLPKILVEDAFLDLMEYILRGKSTLRALRVATIVGFSVDSLRFGSEKIKTSFGSYDSLEVASKEIEYVDPLLVPSHPQPHRVRQPSFVGDLWRQLHSNPIKERTRDVDVDVLAKLLIEISTAATHFDPHCAKTWKLRAIAETSRGSDLAASAAYSYERAIEAAIGHDPVSLAEFIDLYAGWSVMLMEEGRFAEAERICDLAIEMAGPDNSNLQMQKGIICWNDIYRREESLVLLEKASANLTAAIPRALAMSQMWKLKQVVEFYNELLLIHSDSSKQLEAERYCPLVDIHGGAGFALALMMRYNDAVKHFEEALKLPQRTSDVFILAGDSYLALDQLDDAERIYNRALQVNKWDINALHGIALIIAKRGDQTESLQKCVEVVEGVTAEVKDDIVTAKALSMYGQMLVGLGNPEHALVQYEKSLQLNSKDFSVICFKTDALMYLGRLDDVIATADKAIELAPEFYQTYQNKIVALRMLARYDDALKCGEHLLTITSSNHFMWTDQGATYMRMRQFQEAEKCFLKGSELCETSPGLSLLAVLYCKTNRIELAQQAATRALEISTKRNAWQARVAICRSGIQDEAHFEALRALPEATPEDCKKKIWSLRKVSLFAEALSVAKEAHRKYPTQFSIALLMAKLLFVNDRIFDAKKVLETKVFPVAPQARAALRLYNKISSARAE